MSDVLLGNTLATAALAARARQQSWLQKDHKQQGWPLGARANTAHSSWLPSQGQDPQISMYCLKESFHKPTGQKLSNFSSCP